MGANGLSLPLNWDDTALHQMPKHAVRQYRRDRLLVQRVRQTLASQPADTHNADDLLLRTSRPIKQVAEAVGFQNETSFIRAFRAWTGRSPARVSAACKHPIS